MKKRPLIIEMLSYLYFASPLLIVLKLGMLSMPFNWYFILMMIVTPIVGYGIWSVRKWGYYLLVCHSAFMVICNGWLYAVQSHMFPLWWVITVNLMAVGVVVLFVRREVNAPYFNPRLRWWEQAARFYYPDMRVIVKEYGTDRFLFQAKSFDLSEIGIFVATDETVTVGDLFSFEMILVSNSGLYTDGEVVWTNKKQQGEIPVGFGCKFIEPSNLLRKRIRYHLEDIKAKAR